MKARDLELREAVLEERGRCLWCLDQIMVELRRELDKKLLIETERHVIQVKLKLAQAITNKARRAIVAGAKPKSKQEPINGRTDDHDASGGGTATLEGLPPPTPPEG